MLIKEKISKEKFAEIAKDVVLFKLAVDIERRILSAGCELHSDCAEELAEDGSLAKDIWGAGIYVNTRKVDLNSLINIRPGEGNRSMNIRIPEVKSRVEAVIKELLPYGE